MQFRFSWLNSSVLNSRHQETWRCFRRGIADETRRGVLDGHSGWGVRRSSTTSTTHPVRACTTRGSRCSTTAPRCGAAARSARTTSRCSSRSRAARAASTRTSSSTWPPRPPPTRRPPTRSNCSGTRARSRRSPRSHARRPERGKTARAAPTASSARTTAWASPAPPQVSHSPSLPPCCHNCSRGSASATTRLGTSETRAGWVRAQACRTRSIQGPSPPPWSSRRFPIPRRRWWR